MDINAAGAGINILGLIIEAHPHPGAWGGTYGIVRNADYIFGDHYIFWQHKFQELQPMVGSVVRFDISTEGHAVNLRGSE